MLIGFKVPEPSMTHLRNPGDFMLLHLSALPREFHVSEHEKSFCRAGWRDMGGL